MKIAIASSNHQISKHFGHCTHFHLFDIENQTITHESLVENPGHQPGILPKFLHEQGVGIIISGGMGGKAIELFQKHDIAVVLGANGHVSDVIQAFLHGDLESNEEPCDHVHDDHSQHHNCKH